MKINNIKILLLTAIMVLTAINTVEAQNPDSKYRLGQSYEQSGDLDNAARIYKELLDAKPKSEELLKAVIRTYSKQNRFSELASIIEENLPVHESPRLLTTYAEVNWRIGNNKKADEIWEKVLDEYAKRPEVYEMVAGSQTNVRQLRKAIETLERGRDELDNELLFSSDLSKLYVAVGNYQDGVDEILNLFYAGKDLALAQGQIYALMADEEANDYIGKRLRQETDKNPDHILLQSLYSFYLRTVGDYDKALDVAVKLDEMTNSKGRRILAFADQSRGDGQYGIAMKAYEEIINMGRDSRFLANALYGYARSLEQKILEENTITKKQAEKIIDRYRMIIKEFPRELNAAESRYRIAYIAKNYLNDIDMAEEVLKNLIENHGYQRITAKATNELGQIYLMQDDLDKAQKTFQRVIDKFCKISPDDCRQAQYNIADLFYFRGKLDTAQKQFAELSKFSDSDIANNALDRIVHLETNKQFNEALKIYAKAELREFQMRYDDAVELFNKVAEYAPQGNFREQSLLRIAIIQKKRGNLTEADKVLTNILESNEETIFADNILILLGDIQTELGNKEKATEYFKKILVKYPRSIYAQQAREKIRILRGENI